MYRRAICVLLLLLAVPSTGTPADERQSPQEFREAAPGNANDSQCRLPGVDGDRIEWTRFPTLERSRTGAWRRNLRLQPAQRRDPGADAGRSISPEGPVNPGAIASRRWVPGYKPQTVEQKAAYERWLAETRQGQSRLGRSPAGTLLDHAVGNHTSFVDSDHEFSYIVHRPPTDSAVIDLRHAPIKAESPKQKGPSKSYHRSGLTWDEYRLLKELAQSGPETEGAQQAEDESSRTPGFSDNLDGLESITNSGPPDPVIAVSSNFLLEAVNSRFRVWDITQDPPVPAAAEINFNTLFQSVPNCNGSFDPYVDYDEENERWVMITETINSMNGNSYLCVAGSRTADPSAAWNVFSFRSDTATPGQYLDYPKMAIGLDGIYITANNFLDGSTSFAEIRVWALDKTEVYAITPPTSLTVAEASLASSPFVTAFPAQLNGYRTGQWPMPGTPQYFISNSTGTNRIWEWSNPFGQAPAIYGSFATAFGGAPPNAPEMNGATGNLNDTGAADWSGAEVRGDSLWASRSVFCNIGLANSESCIDWIEVDVSGPGPVLLQQQQSGAFGSADVYRYYPDLAVDRSGNMAIAYTRSSQTTFTEIWASGREFSDPPDTLQAESLIVAGSGEYTDGVGCDGTCDRWGDYSSMVTDPDGCRFWYVGEYSDGGNFGWKTRLTSMQYASCSVDSAVNLNKAVYACGDEVFITVTDATALSAGTLAASMTISTANGGPILDIENTVAGDWVGSDCVGGTCKLWTASFSTSAASGFDDDGEINLVDGGTIAIDYIDPHVSHDPQSRVVSVDCRSAFLDGGFVIEGGCEAGSGGEQYRDYIDAGEYIAYTFGLFNPATSPTLSDVRATLNLTGPAASAGLVTVFNPTVHIGAVSQGSVTSAVFNIFVDPAVDNGAYRLSDLNFEVSVTSIADGFTTPQVLTQPQILQADDNIVQQSQCWNFETGNQGWIHERLVESYDVNPVTVNTVEAPWTRGNGCGSETRSDYPEMTCDVNGLVAWMSNADASTCGTFTQSATELTDDILYSPIFGPTSTGNAGNGQPWQYRWVLAEWFYRSQMETSPGSDTPTSAWGHFLSDDYQGVADPAENEVDTAYSLSNAYRFYPDQDWDSGTPWDPNNTPSNYDGLAFPQTVSGPATPGLQWRWALEFLDTDFGLSPTTTPASGGLIIDDMNLIYDQYHAVEQIGVCGAGAAAGVVSFDQSTHADCPSDQLTISVVDGNAGSVTVTVTSSGTGDSETIDLPGGGSFFTTDLTYSTEDGASADDGSLFVTPTDTITVSYDDVDPMATSTDEVQIACLEGDVRVNGLVSLTDNGDGDDYADTNEVASISIQLRNDSGRDLTNVVARIATDDPDIDCIVKDVASFGAISAGGVAVNDMTFDPFRFKVADAAECAGSPPVPPTVTFNVYIVADNFDGASTPQTLTLSLDLDDLAGTVTAVENFDAQPATWSHEVGPGDDNGVTDGATVPSLSCAPYVDDWFWRATGGNLNGGFFLWEDEGDNFPNGSYRDLNDAVLLSPAYKIGSTSTILSFDHEYKFADSGPAPTGLRADGVRVDYSRNGGTWQKLTTLPYDGPLIWNTYCNPLCNGSELGPESCFSENPGNGEQIFNKLDNVTQNWIRVNGGLTGLAEDDTIQFRWRFGSMNSVAGFPDLLFTDGGYGLDNVVVTNVRAQACDTNINPDTGCGVAFDSAGNLFERCGDGDLVVEPTENWEIDVTLKNVGQTDATGTTADLTINGGSGVMATVFGNPAAFGTLAGDGGTATSSFQFTVDSGAVCVDTLLFDITNIQDDMGSHDDALGVFDVQIGQISSQEFSGQDTDPLVAESALQSSTLSPPLSFSVPVSGAILSYDYLYSNPTPTVTSTQLFSPINTPQDGFAVSPLSPSLTFAAGAAISAELEWDSLTYTGGSGNVTICTQIDLVTPNATVIPIKAFDAVDTEPYDVLDIYNGADGGPGSYQIRITERQGAGCTGTGTLETTRLSVVGTTGSATWTSNAQVSLFDGGTSTIVKPFGVVDGGTHDVSAIYDAGGPGTYTIRVEENGGGGMAELTNGLLILDAVECDLGCNCADPNDPQDLTLGKMGTDLLLNIAVTGTPGGSLNVYRATQPNPSTWGAPIATGITDQDAGTPGVQWTDSGAAAPGIDYFYRVTETACGGESSLCPDGGAKDPENLRAGKSASNLTLSFDKTGTSGATYNVYRATQPDSASWGAPIQTGVTDEDLQTPGIQWTDNGAAAPGVDYYYRITETACGSESPL
ncbi:MAG: hypothetical protein OES25_01865 [Acidobacteriota bacterium]|nr:hypothetical protein [Acidobacteriota bacterium]